MSWIIQVISIIALFVGGSTMYSYKDDPDHPTCKIASKIFVIGIVLFFFWIFVYA